MRDDVNRQLNGLSEELRETGQAPQRDLWPGIAAAIDQVEQDQAPRRARSGPGAWQMAALAASVVLLVGMGYLGLTNPDQALVVQTDQTGPTLARAESPASGLAALDDTLRQLNDAMRTDPENHKLARLATLVHKSRANVMRRQTDFMIR